jgi:hypothetical protein
VRIRFENRRYFHLVKFEVFTRESSNILWIRAKLVWRNVLAHSGLCNTQDYRKMSQIVVSLP